MGASPWARGAGAQSSGQGPNVLPPPSYTPHPTAKGTSSLVTYSKVGSLHKATCLQGWHRLATAHSRASPKSAVGEQQRLYQQAPWMGMGLPLQPQCAWATTTPTTTTRNPAPGCRPKAEHGTVGKQRARPARASARGLERGGPVAHGQKLLHRRLQRKGRTPRRGRGAGKAGWVCARWPSPPAIWLIRLLPPPPPRRRGQDLEILGPSQRMGKGGRRCTQRIKQEERKNNGARRRKPEPARAHGNPGRSVYGK